MEEIGFYFWAKVLLFFILLVFSAFFSGSEVAVFGLSPRDKDVIKEGKAGSDRRLRKLIDSPKRTLITILTGNNAVNIAAASVAALVTKDICDFFELNSSLGIVIEIVVVTGLILILSEITPKIIALRNPLLISRKAAGFLIGLKFLLYPVVVFFSSITEMFARILGIEQMRLTYSTDELKTLVEVSEERGQLEESEKEMITSIFEFGETLVKEIMVPRTDMQTIGMGYSLKEIIDNIKEWGFSRYPVFQDNRDNIIGILYAKDLLPYLRGVKEDFDLTKVKRQAYFVPENKEIAELLREFQKNKIHLAVVIDEYGGTAGLVTLEDILEEIVGEIQDEYDREAPLYVRESSDVITADARMDIEDVNEILGGEIIPTEGDFETLGGFIYDLTGRIPSENEGIEHGEYLFIIKEVDGQRLTSIRIEKKGV